MRPTIQLFLPLIQCKRDEFRLRSDTHAALRRVGVDVSFAQRALLFLHDDISFDDLRRWHANRRLELVLVDHNRCTLPDVGDAVRQVIDHHVDERQHLDESLQFKWIRTVGSCCTLIAQLAAHQLQHHHDDVILLLTTIITDTINFDSKIKRATLLDEKIAFFLFNLLSSSQSFEQFSKIVFQEISQAKNNVSSLTPIELLSRDFKSADDGLRLGFSSITISLSEFVLKANLSNDVSILEQFCKSQQIDTLVICVALTEPAVFRRQLAIFSIDNIRFEKLFSFLNTSNLSLTLLSSSSTTTNLVFWDQGDSTASRKQILPLITQQLLLL
jgi:exopolyphosphatase